MFIVVIYDICNDETSHNRTSKVSKCCENYGIRVQNSVFECDINPAQLVMLKNILLKSINIDYDSLKIYHLGKSPENHIETFGRKKSLEHKDCLII
jgi:CRISPR-associated protein Cas2